MSKRLTTTAGAPMPTNETSKTAGSRGPVLLDDYQLIEKLAHQNRERIPERAVHAKGWGAEGTFTVPPAKSSRAGPPWQANWVPPTVSVTCADSL